MALSPVLAAILVVLACTSETRASVVRMRGKTEVFDVDITERGTHFVEHVEIDEDDDIEYFSVPAHNDVNGADFLYDFKMNVTLIRLKDTDNNRKVCYLTPLPSDLPKPSILKTGLREVTAISDSPQIETVAHRWQIHSKIDKMTLRKKVRNFCAQYPVYRLVEYTSDSERPGERIKRQTYLEDIDVCGTGHPGCNWQKWKLRCKFTTSNCVYYVKCRPNTSLKQYVCDTQKHEAGKIMCCEATCPQ